MLSFLITISLFGQSDLEYFPHKEGDYWVYDYHDFSFQYTSREYISKDSLASNGNTYVTKKSRLFDVMTSWTSKEYYIDTLEQVWQFQSPNWSLLFKLNAKLDEQWVVSGNSGNYLIAKVNVIRQDTIFNLPTTIKEIEYYTSADSSDTTGFALYGYAMAKGLGIINYGGEGNGFYSLRGTVINNQIYGDTSTITEVKNVTSPTIPNKYMLLQNYPNPFNPSTNIEFTIPRNTRVRISIYNLLGEKIMDLLNEEVGKGQYKIKWNGKNMEGKNLSSGVYLIMMKTNSYQKIIKALLLK